MAKAKKQSKEKTKKKEKSVFGHLPGTQSFTLDQMIIKGSTIDQMMKKCKVGRPRILAHIKHLRDEKNVEITVENDVYRATTTDQGTIPLVQNSE